MRYQQYIDGKLSSRMPVGIQADLSGYDLNPHQKALAEWALRRGKAAIFADTGLGKTRMQLAWADTLVKSVGCRVLILAPLSVAVQTAEEAKSIGIDITLCREPEDVASGINITNYERLHKFDAHQFDAVVLDESSIIKHHTAKTFSQLTEAFAHCDYKLCATATPSPNDYTELGTHAEFLGICTRAEMLAEYFVHDAAKTQDWRLKGHAKAVFWRWVSSWGAMVRKPSDLGFDDGAYNLPPLHIQQHTVLSDIDHANERGFLFPVEATEMQDRRDARRRSITQRVAECIRLVEASDEKWLVWCDLNAEQDALEAAFQQAGISVASIRGSTELEARLELEQSWRLGEVQVLLSKGSIFGFGMNWQHCRNMAFVGVTDSYEAYYQSVRRCWRFGQNKEVFVHIIASEAEGSVVANIKRKERDAQAMADELSAATGQAVRESVIGQQRIFNPYQRNEAMQLPSWLISEKTSWTSSNNNQAKTGTYTTATV